MKKKYFVLVIFLLGLGLLGARNFFIKPIIPQLDSLNLTTIRQSEHPNATKSVNDIVTALQQKQFSSATINLADNLYEATSGIAVKPTDSVVVITSRGYAYATTPKKKSALSTLIQFPRVGGGLICATNWIKYLKISIPVISFDYFDDWRNFDFGLSHDSACLDNIINEILKQNPNCSIILIGTCKGSRSILHYLTQNQVKNIKAVILDAPFASVSDLTIAFHKNYVPWLPWGAWLLSGFLKWWFSNYDPTQELTERLWHLPKDLPILIGHLKNDTLVTDGQMKNFMRHFENPDRLYVAVISHPTITHSKLSHMRPFQQIANAFLEHYQLPYNKQLADQGQALLNIAHYNTMHPHSWVTIKSN